MKKIQVLKPKYRVDECLKEIKECLEIGWTGMGFKTLDFEKAWSNYTGLGFSHFLNSATVGLHLALKVLKERHGWDDYDEVITTPLTFVSTNHAIKYVNMEPCFVDIDDSLNLSPEHILNSINKKTRAIIFVGIGGNTKNLLEVIDIAKKHNLKLILDAAHMAGSFIKKRHVGFDCDVSVFSFQAVKNLPTADSGMICFNNEADDQAARRLSWLGISKDTFSRNNKGSYLWDYNVDQVGYKYHGNSIMAAIGLVSLKYLDEDNAYRRRLAERYIKNLKNKVNIIEHESNETSRHLFQITVEDRELVIQKLYQNEVFPGVHYRQNTEYLPFRTNQKLDKAKYYSDRLLSLPLHLNLTEDDIDFISEIILTP